MHRTYFLLFISFTYITLNQQINAKEIIKTHEDQNLLSDETDHCTSCKDSNRKVDLSFEDENSICKEENILDEPIAYIISIGPVNQNPNSKKPDNSFKTWTVYELDSKIPLPNGMTLSTEDHIIRAIWMKIADERNIAAMMGSDNNYAEEYLKQMENQKGINSATIKQMCEKGGFTFEDLKKEINIQHLVQQAIEITLTAKGMLLVTPEEIETYAKEFPVIIDTSYTMIQGKKNPKGNTYTWYDPFTVEEKKLAKKIQHVSECNPGDTILTSFNETDGVETIYKLKEINPGYTLSASNRRDEITRKLQAQKYKEGIKKILLDTLEDTCLIIFTDENYRKRLCDYIKHVL